MKAPVTRVILVVGAVFLFVLLFIAPKVISSGERAPQTPANPEGSAVSANVTLDVYLDMAKKGLTAPQNQQVDTWLKAGMEDSVVTFWDKQKRPDLASYYSEVLAGKQNTAKSWFNAGNRYYYAVQFSRDKTEIPVLYQCALRCFSKGLKLEPNNTDAKIMLASCYVEGTSEPMEGVSRLREIEKTDSNNVKLQLTFAFFSVRSGQLDKAERRFNKVLAIDSTYIEAYLHLADVFEKQGRTAETISSLEKYAARTGDPTEKSEIKKYISQLRQSQ